MSLNLSLSSGKGFTLREANAILFLDFVRESIIVSMMSSVLLTPMAASTFGNFLMMFFASSCGQHPITIRDWHCPLGNFNRDN